MTGRLAQPLTGRRITSAPLAGSQATLTPQRRQDASRCERMPNVHEDALRLTCSNTLSPRVLVASLVARATASVALTRGAQGPRCPAVPIRYGLRLPRVVAGQSIAVSPPSRTFKVLSCVSLREPRVPSARVEGLAQCVGEPHPVRTSPLSLQPLRPSPRSLVDAQPQRGVALARASAVPAPPVLHIVRAGPRRSPRGAGGHGTPASPAAKPPVVHPRGPAAHSRRQVMPPHKGSCGRGRSHSHRIKSAGRETRGRGPRRKSVVRRLTDAESLFLVPSQTGTPASPDVSAPPIPAPLKEEK